MDSSVFVDIDSQILCLQQALAVTKSLKEKCKTLENEKNEALERCVEFQTKIERMSKEKCTNCNVLLNKLNEERKKKEEFIKKEKAKLLKSIAKTLENLDEGNTNQVTNAHQLFTELVSAGLEMEQGGNKKVLNLIEENDYENEADSKILVNETIVDDSEGSEDFIPRFYAPVVIPETEPLGCLVPQSPRSGGNARCNNISRSSSHQLVVRTRNKHVLKENRNLPEEETDIQQVVKKSKCSPVLSGLTNRNVSPKSYNSPIRSVEVDANKTLVLNQSVNSPSVLSELIQACDHSNSRLSGTSNSQEDKATKWKMKPSVLVESNTGTANRKKMKQMTLSLARTEKKHDISLSERFKGGIAGGSKLSDDEKDMVLPSPDRSCRTGFVWNAKSLETMEDLDLTVFNPAITSTCLPVDNSYDRLPQVPKSPPYKYRRDTLRKRDERKKLPGQDCDECAKYYEAAGLDNTQDIRSRMNACSRHRDKYQLRMNTPPGFWDPVLPASP